MMNERRNFMTNNKTTSSVKSSRKSSNHVSDILESMNQETRYLTPIFGTEASDIEMPNKKINENPVAPQVAAEIIREYLNRRKCNTKPCNFLSNLYGTNCNIIDG